MIVNSVTGEVNSNKLGITLIHEHMRIRSDEVFNQFPHIYDEEKELQNAISDVNKVLRFGVKTIFDPTVLGLGRDVKFLKKVSEETGVQLIMATGIYTYDTIPIHFQNQSINYMRDIFLRDIEIGVQNTNIKAGFLKCSADALGITDDIEKVTRAVARASIQTNKPIMTHSKPSTKNGLNQVKILLEEGVKPNKILIGHTGDSQDLEYIKTLLDYGVFIGMDRYGLDKFANTDSRNNVLLHFLQKGYSKQIFLSQDYCCSTDWYSEEKKKKDSPNWSMDYLFTTILPEITKNGVSKEMIEDMMIKNTVSWIN